MNPVTAWREALVTLLAATFPAADVASGFRDTGVSRDKDRIRIFWPGTPIDKNVNYARPQLTVRYWVKLPKASAQLKVEQRDDSPLEQAAWDLATALMPVRTTLVTDLYFELVSIAPSRDDFAVEAQLGAWIKNPATIG